MAITGVGGQLGSALVELQKATWDVDGIPHSEVDIRNWSAVRDRIARFEPDLVIHAAAATNVDGCEREPDQAFAVNAAGTRYVARAAASVGAVVVYVSTNYVFDGQKGSAYHEYDSTRPISVYGLSKLAGEAEAMAATPNSYVVRTGMLYAEQGSNFVNTMRRLMAERDTLRVVDDQRGNPTYASDLAAAIVEIVNSAPPGIYHAVNSGTASWYEWAVEIARLTGASTEIEPIPATEFQRDAEPPANGAMESLLLPSLGIQLPDWRNALERSLRR